MQQLSRNKFVSPTTAGTMDSASLGILVYLYADRFTVAGMGEDFSVNLGLNYRQVVNIGLTVVALVTAVVVLTVGMLPFLGLIIPNIVTMYRGDNLKGNLPHAAVPLLFLPWFSKQLSTIAF